MAADSEAKSHKRFLDVVSPGKTPADSTSRPVLVTNRPIVKDPTLKHDNEDDPEIAQDADGHLKEEKSPVESETKPIYPIHPDLKKSEEVKDDSTDNDQINPGQADAVKQAELTDAEKARQEEINKLIESGKYAVPIGDVKLKRNMRRVFIVLSVIALAVVLAMYALMK